MPSFGQLFVSIGADISGLQKGLDGAEADLKKASRSLGKLGADFTAVGSKLTVGLTAPILGAAAAAFTFSKDFNAAMANVATLIPGNTARIAELKGQVQDLAVKTGKSTDDIARGLYQVVSAFGDSADSAKLLSINATAAAAGLATTEDAISLTSAVTKGYGDTSAEAAQKAADLAFKAVELGQTTFPELASAIGRVVPLSAELAVSQEELFGVMATATGVTGTASEVSTQLRGVLQSLLAPTKEMGELFGKLGVASGEALIEQQGLQGAIETVVGAAQASGVPLQKYVSSIEAQTLALALSGPQADAFSKKLGAMENAVGSVDKAFKEQTGGINKAGFEFEQLKVRAEVVAQRFGDSLQPAFDAVIKLADKLVSAVEFVVKTFGELPEPIQLSVIGLAGLAAAAGPVLLVAGQLAFAVQNLIVLFPSLGAAMTAASAKATAMGGAMGIAQTAVVNIGKAAVVAAAAFAAWELGKWAAENIPAVQRLGDAINDYLLDPTGRFREALKSGRLFGADPDALQKDLQALSDALEKTGIKVERGNMTLLEWGKALREAGKEAQVHKTKTGELVGPVQEVAEAYKNSGYQASAFSAAVSDAVTKLEEQAKQAEINAKAAEIYQRRHSDSTREFNKSVDAAIRSLEEQAKQERINAIAAQEYAVAHDGAGGSIKRLVFDVDAYIEKLKEQDAQAKKSAEEQGHLAEAIGKSVVPVLDKAQQSSAALVVAMTNSVPAIESAGGGFYSLKESIEGFGIKSQSVARGELQELSKQLEVIRKQAAEGNPDALAALSEAQRKYDEAVKASIGGTNDWGEALKQVSTIITDFAKNVSEKFVSVLTGGDRRAFNRALDEQAEELRQQLDEATGDLEISLADRESAYRDYVMEIADSEQEIRDASARRLADELQDLQDSLAAKTQSYQRFIDDVNTTLGRKQSDFTDDIADEKKKTAQTIAERRKRNARDIADARTTLDRKTRDFEAQIREELAKGAKADHDRIAALRRRIADEQEDFRVLQQRKLEDLNIFIAQEQAALAEFEEEKRQKLARETEDIQKDLARREEDYAAYVDEINAKAAEITEKIRTEEQAKLAALQESLAKQTAEYEKFKVDTLAKYEETKTGINAKLDELAEKHRSVTDDIKGLFSTAFTEAGTAITRFVTEVLVGKLFKELGKLTTEILPGVGKALASIFGGGTDVAAGVGSAVAAGTGAAGQAAGAAGEIAGAAGSAGSAAGTAASDTLGSIASITGIVTGIVSAISGVISNFQLARQETTLNAIELNTRKTSRVLEGDRGPGDLGIIGALFSISETLQFGTFVKVLEQIRDTVSGGLSVTGGGTAEIGFLVGNTDEMKTTLWDIRGILREGVAVVGMAAVMTGTTATAENTAVTASGTQEIVANTTPGHILGRTRIGNVDESVVPTGIRGRTRIGVEIPGTESDPNADLEELRRRNPMAFGSSNPLASILLGGRDPQSFGADIGAGIDLSGLQTEFEAAQQTANNQLSALHDQTAQLESIQDAIEAQQPSIVINIQNVNGTDQRAVEALMKEVERRLRTTTRGIR